MQYRELIDSAITRTSYGASLSDVACDLISGGVNPMHLTNVMRLVKYESKRSKKEKSN